LFDAMSHLSLLMRSVCTAPEWVRWTLACPMQAFA
jgi:hypothetical protein